MAKPTKPDPLKHFTVAETADMLGVSEKTVRREIDAERLFATEIRGATRFSYAEILRYVAASKKTAKRKKTKKPKKPKAPKKPTKSPDQTQS